MSNKKIVMIKKPIDFPGESNFKLISEDSIDLNKGEVRLQTLWLSLDPYMRGAMNRISEGETMVGELIGKVTESKSEIIPEGTIVLSKAGWQTSPVVNENDIKIVDSPDQPKVGEIIAEIWPHELVIARIRTIRGESFISGTELNIELKTDENGIYID